MISGNTGKENVFPALVPRRKWNADRRNVRVNDVVVVENPNVVRGNWTIGKVMEVFPGKDSKVRNVRVKTSCGEYERPVNRIAVIYPEEGYCTNSNFCMRKTFSSGRRVC